MATAAKKVTRAGVDERRRNKICKRFEEEERVREKWGRKLKDQEWNKKESDGGGKGG